MAADNLLQTFRHAAREYTLALEHRRRVRREFRKAEDRVAEARRKLRMVERLVEESRGPGPILCTACGATLGNTPACLECSAHRALVEVRSAGAHTEAP